jgi:hypothetical protein
MAANTTDGYNVMYGTDEPRTSRSANRNAKPAATEATAIA